MTRLFCVIAHPDDETILTGGALALAARQGVQVYIVCATRGEGGEMGEPPLTTRENLGKVREQELINAAHALGVQQVIFLGFQDTLMTDRVLPMRADLLEIEWKLVSLIREYRPDVVLTHGTNGEYGHPQHRQVNRATSRAFFGARDPFRFPDAGVPFMPRRLYYFAARPRNLDIDLDLAKLWWGHRVNKSDAAHLTLDISPVLDSKEAAAKCHRTQMALFMRRQDAPTSLRGRMNHPEYLHRAFPAGDREDKDMFE